MQNVGQVDSYAQFIKLVQEARLRSQGTKAVTTTGGVRNKMNVQQYKPAGQPPAVSTIQGSPLEQKSKTKVVGSFFDAYA
jgi:hypothetical protein